MYIIVNQRAPALFVFEVFSGDAQREGRQDDEHACHEQPYHHLIESRCLAILGRKGQYMYHPQHPERGRCVDEYPRGYLLYHFTHSLLLLYSKMSPG